MSFLRLVWIYLKLGALNELQYRSNFFIQAFQSLLSLAVGLIGLQIVFNYTDNLAGWSHDQLLSLLGTYLFIGGLLQVFIQPNMDRLIGDIHKGALDFHLIKPQDSQLMVSIQEFRLWQSVDIFTGLVVLLITTMQMEKSVGLGAIALFLLMAGMGMVMLYSVWLILATSAFWFIKTWDLLGIFNSLYQTSRWPVAVYPEWLRVCLTFILPVGFAVSVPSMALSGNLTTGMVLQALVYTVLIFIMARWFWRFGLRHYSGASS